MHKLNSKRINKVLVNHGIYYTRKADLIKKDLKCFFLKRTVKKGQNRQIMRIASLLGYKVIDLQRVNFANISLVNINMGEWKLININKIQNF